MSESTLNELTFRYDTSADRQPETGDPAEARAVAGEETAAESHVEIPSESRSAEDLARRVTFVYERCTLVAIRG